MGSYIEFSPEAHRAIEGWAVKCNCTFGEAVRRILEGDIEDWPSYFAIEKGMSRTEITERNSSEAAREKFFTDWLEEQREDNTRIGRFAKYVTQDTSWPAWSQMEFIYTYYLKKCNASCELIATFHDIWQEYLDFSKVWLYAADVPTVPIAMRVPIKVCTWMHNKTLLGTNKIANSLLEDAIRKENQDEVDVVVGIPKDYYIDIEKLAGEFECSVNDLLVSLYLKGIEQSTLEEEETLKFNNLLDDIEIDL